jgi:thymidylate synthase (FAD)
VTRSDYSKAIHIYDDNIGKVEYVEHMGDDLTVVNSARVSFGAKKEELDDRDRKLIKYLIKHRHTSTLEHNAVTFRFCVPLYVRSQHHRHRTWAYNEISRRYTDVDIRFYEPQGFRTQHKSNRQASNAEELIDPKISFDGASALFEPQPASVVVKGAHHGCLELYNNLIKAGVCREQARGVLPQNMYTEYYGTVNLNNLLKFIDLRTHEGAQWEIQQMANACLEIATDLFPITVGAYREIRSKNG